MFRGLLGIVFSRGLDKLKTKLEKLGHDVELTSWGNYAKYKGQEIDVLIGHSLGARVILKIGRSIKGLKLVVCYDYVTGAKQYDAPITNTYNFKTKDFRARKVEGAINIDVKENHVKVASAKWVHDLTIGYINRLI
jgi:hypothetical protein